VTIVEIGYVPSTGRAHRLFKLKVGGRLARAVDEDDLVMSGLVFIASISPFICMAYSQGRATMDNPSKARRDGGKQQQDNSIASG
jgi:hypothetical protein